MEKFDRYNEKFLRDMRNLARETGLDEEWELDEGKEFTFLYGGFDEAEDGSEPFHWEFAATFRRKGEPEDELYAYGVSEGRYSVNGEGFYEPYGLESDDSWVVGFDGKEVDGEDAGAFPKGSDAAILRDSFSDWLDGWFEWLYE